MPPMKQREVESSLVAKGFRRREGDHRFFVYHRMLDGKKTSIFTKTSHGNSEIDDSLIKLMANQCKLTSKDFRDLVNCPLKRDAYETRIAARGIDVGLKPLGNSILAHG